MALLDWRHTIHHQTRSLVNQDTLLGLCDTCGRLWKQDAAIARQILKELRTTCEARKLPLYEAAGRIGPDLLSDFSWQVGHNWVMIQWIGREKYEKLAGNHGFYHGFPQETNPLMKPLVPGWWSTGKPGRSTCFGLLGLLAPRGHTSHRKESIRIPATWHQPWFTIIWLCNPPKIQQQQKPGLYYVWYWISIYSCWWFQTFFILENIKSLKPPTR